MSTFFITSLVFGEINNVLIPIIYCIILLLFLLLLCVIITLQLIYIFTINNHLSILNKKKDTSQLNKDDTIILSKIYMKKQLWLSSIKMLESIDLNYKCFNLMGFSYYSMKQYNIAKVYYLKSLELKKDYLVALKNLAKVYELTEDFSLALKAYNSILHYDKDSIIAINGLMKIKNRDSRI
uniref:hypothetical protein n=1 Tax=Synarthrophyton patena TaxID=48972 RepID=UPI0021824FD4|nr:hypothetical protein N4M48_pgp178 [Synarthrophyton patena]UVF62843.1 hypothetical protein [Synarthrophyton patena]